VPVQIALIALLSLALLAAGEAAYHGLRLLSERRGRDLRRRLQADGRPTGSDPVLLRQGRFSSSVALDEWLQGQAWARGVEYLLEQADSGLTVAQLLALSALGALAGGSGGALLGPGPAVALAALGGGLPWVVPLAARERRSRKLSEQLPEAVDMMARSLRAGHALTSAFELVAKEMPEPIAVEFARAYEQQRLGMPLERAVREMAARAPRNGDLKIFAVSTVIQKETGGNLSEILDGLASTVRERYRFFGKLRGLTAEARMSAWVVSLTPIGVGAFLAVSQPGYMRVLITDPMGRTILMAGMVAWVVGALWFHRLTKFDF
jgi:tight adherence protein B